MNIEEVREFRFECNGTPRRLRDLGDNGGLTIEKEVNRNWEWEYDYKEYPIDAALVTALLSEIDRLKAEVELREKALEQAKRNGGICFITDNDILGTEPHRTLICFNAYDTTITPEEAPDLAAWLREKESERR